jgi:hypothetical protein
MNDMEKEAIRLSSLIRASEDWSKEYAKDPVTHAKLIKLESQWEWALRKLFKRMADKAGTFFSAYQYSAQVTADFNVDVIVTDDNMDEWNGEMMKVSLEVVTELIATGALAGQTIYGRPLGLSSTDELIQKLGMDRVAALVGKRVLPDGSIVDNPRPEYNVTETIRRDIAQAIKNSLALHENLQDATDRVANVINNRTRASTIAQTEGINAYQAGLRQFALSAKMVGKEWQDVGAKDKCAEFSALGIVPINYSYDGVDSPTAHPHCRCGMRYVSASERPDLAED